MGDDMHPSRISNNNPISVNGGPTPMKQQFMSPNYNEFSP